MTDTQRLSVAVEAPVDKDYIKNNMITGSATATADVGAEEGHTHDKQAVTCFTLVECLKNFIVSPNKGQRHPELPIRLPTPNTKGVDVHATGGGSAFPHSGGAEGDWMNPAFRKTINFTIISTGTKFLLIALSCAAVLVLFASRDARDQLDPPMHLVTNHRRLGILDSDIRYEKTVLKYADRIVPMENDVAIQAEGDADFDLMPRATAVVMTVNDNPKYLAFLPIVCDAWAALGIEPHLFLIMSKGTKRTEADIMKDIKHTCVVHPVFVPDDWKTGSIAQIARLVFPATLTDHPNVMIADVDSAPVGNPYWDTSGGQEEGTFINMRFKDNSNMFMGHNSASPLTWARIFCKSDVCDLATAVEVIGQWKQEGLYDENRWGSDQYILTLLTKGLPNVVRLNPDIYALDVTSDGSLCEITLHKSNEPCRPVEDIDCKRHIWLIGGSNGRVANWSDWERDAHDLLPKCFFNPNV